MSKWTKDLTVQFELSVGEECISYEADVEVTVIYDPSYGEDADGNRGIPMTSIDNIEILECRQMDGETVVKELSEGEITDEIEAIISDKVDEADLSDDYSN